MRPQSSCPERQDINAVDGINQLSEHAKPNFRACPNGCVHLGPTPRWCEAGIPPEAK